MFRQRLLIYLLIISSPIYSQYTTPGTGVNWNLDSLVIHSSGAVMLSARVYSVLSMVTVSAGDKLSVPPGSVVNFTNINSGITVNGVFFAVGNDSSRITFLPALADSTGSYQGFIFNDTSVDSLSRIAYANISFAYYGLRCIDASPRFDHNLVVKCRRGVQLSGSSAYIGYNIIARSYEYGITMTLASSPVVEYNDIYDNNTQNTSAKTQITVGTQGNNSPIIRYNKIHGSTNTKTGGVAVSALVSGASSTLAVYANDIYSNSYGITAVGFSINGIIAYNSIHDNNISSDTNASGSGINLNGDSTVTPLIAHNYIANNLWGITIQNGSAIKAGPRPVIGIKGGANQFDEGQNAFRNNNHGGIIYDIYNNCTNSILAQNNDWGVYDSSLIEQRVYHRNDNPLLGYVLYTPFSQSLPVELTSFFVRVQKGVANICWTTASESNIRRFRVYKSVLGGAYTECATVMPAPDLTGRGSYACLDRVAGKSPVKYKLEISDYDGGIQVLGIRELPVLPEMDLILGNNYPNPFNPATRIEYTLPVSGYVLLQIFSATGELLQTPVGKHQDAGIYSVDFSGNGLPSGMYFYKLSSGGKTIARKMVLLK